ncbi:transient receptor potential cation channel protein painless [Anabrus simplex]|uniref:transient receptor potential cation channel protein painless n=1 Tax=Anabrus simplex TaxID=316456 RepID=UPI0035A36B8E
MAEGVPRAEKQTKFLDALQNAEYEDFEELFNDPEVKVSYKYGKPHFKTALEIACQHKDREKFVKLLLTKVKPNVNTIVPEPIHYAAASGATKTLQLLLSDKKVKVNAEDSRGRTALHYAAKHFETDDDSHEQCIKLLMMHPNIDINKPSGFWYTPIHEAANSCKQAVVAMLNYARQELDLDRYRASGRTARETIEMKYPELKDILPLQTGILSQESDPHIQLINALRNKYTDLFRFLLIQQNSDGKNLLDPNHWYSRPLNATCLELACREPGSKVFVETLLEAGANPNIVNRVNGKSPIHVAVESGNVEALEVLLKCGAVDVNATDNLGKTVLHYTVSRDLECDNRCLETLLNSSRIDINLQDCGGFTPVMLAVEMSNRKALELILNQSLHNVDFDTAPVEYDTPRTLISDTYPDLAEKLPSENMRRVRRTDCTAFLYQHLHKQQEGEFVTLLRERAGEITSIKSSCESRPETLLQCACKYGLKEAVRTLLKLGFNPNEITKENKSPPIIESCIKRDSKALKILLDTSPACKVNASDMKGNTALHYAVKNSDLESSILLLTYGANLNCKNSTGKYPMNAKDIKVILDKCIDDNKKFPDDEEYAVLFDYRFLTSYTEGQRGVSRRRESFEEEEMNPFLASHTEGQCDVPTRKQSFEAIEMNQMLPSQTEGQYDGSTTKDNSVAGDLDQQNQGNTYDSRPNVELDLMYFMTQSKEYRELLSHPIVNSFLNVKWRKLKLVSYVNIIIYMVFLVCLNIYVSPYGRQNVTNKLDNTTFGNGSEVLSSQEFTGGEQESIPESRLLTRIFLWISLCILCMRELLQLTMSFERYLKGGENYLDLAILILTVVKVVTPASQHGELLRVITVVVVLLSWTELLLLIGRVSKFAKNIEMLKLVLKTYLSVSLSYSIIFLAFVMSFHILLWNVRSEENWYDSFPMSFLKTFIMTTGEFDANKSYFQSIPVVANVLFVLFVMIVSIVVLNLLIGMAVNDIQSIQKDAELLHLETRVKVAWEMESILLGLYHNVVKDRWILAGLSHYFGSITIFPLGKEKIGRVYPNKGTLIEMPDSGARFSLKSDILDKALKIIHDRMRRAERNG